MGLFSFFRGKEKRGTDRFAPVSKEDGMLSPKQVTHIMAILPNVQTEVLYLADVSDEMLPECAIFIPNLLAEFQQDSRLGMIHGLGNAHAWIHAPRLRDALSRSRTKPCNYSELFESFAEAGYKVKKIRYIYFRTDLKTQSAKLDNLPSDFINAAFSGDIPGFIEAYDQMKGKSVEAKAQFLESWYQKYKNC
jgi:hypothetical protein